MGLTVLALRLLRRCECESEQQQLLLVDWKQQHCTLTLLLQEISKNYYISSFASSGCSAVFDYYTTTTTSQIGRWGDTTKTRRRRKCSSRRRRIQHDSFACFSQAALLIFHWRRRWFAFKLFRLFRLQLLDTNNNKYSFNINTNNTCYF